MTSALSSWKSVQLGDVCKIDKKQDDHAGLPYVGMEHIESQTGRFVGSLEPQTVKSKTFCFGPQHVLYGRLRPYLNKVITPDFEGHCATEIFPLLPSERLSRAFLQYWLMQDETVQAINATCTGARMPRANMKEVMGFAFPLPPLSEQRRLVGLLDAAFAGLATATAHTQKNLQNARELFETKIAAEFSDQQNGWNQATLRDVCETITDGTHQTPKYFDDGFIFLSSRNVTSRRIDWENVKYIDREQHEQMQKRVAPRRDDILLAKNGTTGVAAIVDRDHVFDIYVSLALLRPSELVRPRFLLHFVNSPIAKEQFNKRLKGVGVPNLHLREIRAVRIRFPSSLEVQDRIVASLDELREQSQLLSAVAKRKLAALEELKQSILHRAFRGELAGPGSGDAGRRPLAMHVAG